MENQKDTKNVTKKENLFVGIKEGSKIQDLQGLGTGQGNKI